MSTAKVAVVTGASRGIGRWIAVELARTGYSVALLGRAEQDLHATAKLCEDAVAAVKVDAERAVANAQDDEEERGHPPAKRVRTAVGDCSKSYLPFIVDLRNREEVDTIVAAIVKTWGTISVLVCNAGVLLATPVLGGQPEKWEEEIDVNVKGTMAITHAALPHILGAATGATKAIVIIGSTGSRWSWPWGGGYCASKHALRGYAGSVFEEVRDKGVKVCLIMPGFTDTAMTSANPGMINEKKMRPEDVAHAVTAVLSFPASACPTEMLIRPQFTCTDGTVPYTIV